MTPAERATTVRIARLTADRERLLTGIETALDLLRDPTAPRCRCGGATREAIAVLVALLALEDDAA
jgi:hypothetical protein